MAALLSFAKKIKFEKLETFNYFDEVSSLMNGTPVSKIQEFLITRYSDDESIDIDTLKLGKGISSSII